MGDFLSLLQKEDSVPRPHMQLNRGPSLIVNLFVDLSDHLRKVHKSSDRVYYFIQTKWLPHREASINGLQKLIGVHVDQNVLLNKVLLAGKIVGASGKLVAVGGIAFLPVAAGGFAVSLIGDVMGLASSLSRSGTVKESKEKAELLLKADWKMTEQFKELVSDYNMLMLNVENTVKKLHESTLAGCFDEIKKSPAIEKFLNKVREFHVLNPQTIVEIIKAFASAIKDDQAHSDVSDVFFNLALFNPGCIQSVIQGVETLCSGLGLFISATRVGVAVAGRIICCGFTLLMIAEDFKAIGKLFANLDDGNDKLVIELGNILGALVNEKILIEDVLKEENQN